MNGNEIQKQFDDLNNELEYIRKEYMRGLLLRANCKWIENGEKPTKYFLTLEKRNYVNKNTCISRLVGDNKQEITDQRLILQEIEHFYSKLFESKDDQSNDVNLKELISDEHIPKLDNMMQCKIKGKISNSEILYVLKI